MCYFSSIKNLDNNFVAMANISLFKGIFGTTYRLASLLSHGVQWLEIKKSNLKFRQSKYFQWLCNKINWKSYSFLRLICIGMLARCAAEGLIKNNDSGLIRKFQVNLREIARLYKGGYRHNIYPFKLPCFPDLTGIAMKHASFKNSIVFLRNAVSMTVWNIIMWLSERDIKW